MSDSPLSVRWPRSHRRKQEGGKSSKRKQDASPPDKLDDDALMALSAKQFPTPDLFTAAAYAGTCIHAVNNVELVTDCQGVAYWPAEEALLVADLHLEKGSSFARRGQLIPPYDTITTLRRLAGSIDKWQPRKVIALGDSFHDSAASARLTPDARAMLIALMKGREWTWIKGNHDPDPPVDLGGEVMHELRHGNLVLRHEPKAGPAAGEIAGHLHPKARLVRRGRHVRRSCFAASRSRMILPSFGAYTGGLSVFHRAFDGLFEERRFHALMRGDNQVYRISSADLS